MEYIVHGCKVWLICQELTYRCILEHS